jgi:uncharacterized protein (DUF983 family)
MQATSKGVTYTAERCPMCAEGKVFSEHTQLFRDCTFCAGLGTVFPSHKCACGASPTQITSDGFMYCGKKVCLDDLKRDAATSVESLGYTGFGWHSPSGYDSRYSE